MLIFKKKISLWVDKRWTATNRKPSKWGVTMAEYPPDKYPPMVPGSSYILTRDIIEGKYFRALDIS